MAALCIFCMAQAAMASGFTPGSTCHISAEASQSYASLAAHPERWTCTPGSWSIRGERAMLRFDLRGGSAPHPQVFVTSIARFRTLSLTVIGADGRSVSKTTDESGMEASKGGWSMMTSLPRIDGPAAYVVATIDAPAHPRILSEARITDWKHATTVDLRFLLMVAGLCGMLCMPLLANLAFYRVLRERFLLWHAAAAVLMLIHTLAISGLINSLAKWSIGQLSAISAISFGSGIVAAAMFSADLIEEEMLDPLHRKLLRSTAIWIPSWVAVYLLGSGVMRPFSWIAYYVQFLPVLALFTGIICIATWRGSRAVRFQIAAWAPFMMLGVARILSAMGITVSPMEFEPVQHLCITWEVAITTLGVIDRFMAIKRERDNAQAEVVLMEALVDQDPLTGLLNRRALESRFIELQERGFRGMAVIDLDHFKSINDAHGHAMGDAVLRVVSEVLAPDKETIAVRMGGEEFLLLMTGRDIAARAERRRQSIPARVATMVPGLDRVVTGSMGLVIEEGGLDECSSFLALYKHCDLLLYEAKNRGRNRTVSECLQAASYRDPVLDIAV